MSYYLGIITAYAAVAVLAWLAALLQPELVPPADPRLIQKRWREAGIFTAAALLAFGIGWSQSRGWLLPGDGVLITSLNQLLNFAPILAYLVWKRSLAAMLVPARGFWRSLALGLALAAVALAAYCSARDQWSHVPALLGSLFVADNVAAAIGLVLQDLAIAALLALLADGWSRRTALLTALVLFAVIHLPWLLANGLTAANTGAMLANAALVAGMISAILYTRNVVWFIPAHALLALAAFESI